MTVTVTSALAGPATARYSNVYGALVDMGVLSGLGAQDVTGSGDPVAPILNAAGFYGPTTHSLILTRGTGDPTFTRATSAWEFDNEGKLILVPSGAARFGGARMVKNHITGSSEDLSNAAWNVLGGASKTGNAVTFGNSDAYYQTTSTAISSTDVVRFWIDLDVTVACNLALYIYAGSSQQSVISATPGRKTYSVLLSGFVGGSFSSVRIYAAGTAVTVTHYRIQVETVTGQVDQTASEYVSVGVLSAPYHGAGVDGVKWFNTNKDGSAIAASSLLGYHSEGARTNSLLYSRDLRGNRTSGTGPWVSNGNGTELIVNGGFDADTNWTHYGTSISGGVLVFSAQPSGAGAVQNYSVTPGLYKLTFDISGYSSGRVHCDITGYTSPLSFTANGTHTEYIYVSANTISFRVIAMAANTTLNVDNVSVQRCAIQPSTCTGIDNAANSASTLTAGAADATILQTLTLAAAARSFSAYVKRRTGSGSVYITRDGGTNWTDITSSLGASWTRVKIENTSVLNPSVGFKIATSGDAIDVDCVQDEAGASISSPIITTTAAVTRNADAETFQTASNWSDTAGWALATVQGESWANATGTAIGNGTNGLKLSASNSGIVAYDGTNTVNGPAGSPSGAKKLAMTWGSGALQAASGGVAGSAGSYDGAWGLATVGIGTSQGNVYIKDVYIGQSALTAAQLVQVTT